MAAAATLETSKSHHISTAVWPIPTKFCTMIKTTKCPFVGGPNIRITNPRWRTAAILEKSRNRHVSGKGSQMVMKFSMVKHFDPETVRTHSHCILTYWRRNVLLWPLWNRAGHYIFALWFLSFFFFWYGDFSISQNSGRRHLGFL